TPGTTDVDVDAANVPANPAPLTAETEVAPDLTGAVSQTEYGIKAIPLGGFCEIAGMTPLDELSEDEEPHAMYRKPWWQRVIVLSGGIAGNVLVALIVLYSVANIWGLPDHKADIRTTVQSTQCAPLTQQADGTLADCTGDGPAAAAGITPGDPITEVDGRDVPAVPALTTAIERLVAPNAAGPAGGESPPQSSELGGGDTLAVRVRVQRGDGTNSVKHLDVGIVERRIRYGATRLAG